VLWEEKTAVFAIDVDAWIARHITRKFALYLEMRQYLPGHENAAIGFHFSAIPLDELKSAVEAAVEALRRQNPGVTIHLRCGA